MSLLLDRDGYVALSPSKLALLECPRRGHWYLDRPDTPPSAPAAVGRAAHVVLATLARRGWPEDAFDLLPEVVDEALTREGLRSVLPSDEFCCERSALLEALRRFVVAWPLPRGSSAHVEVQARLEDRVGHLRLYGRLDLLTLPLMPGDAARVLDWKTGAMFADEEAVPLAAIGQAALARARLGLRCPVTVQWIFVKSLAEQVWHFSQSALVEGFARIRELAADIAADRWSPRPGERCVRCPVVDCEYQVAMPDAAGLGLLDPEEI